MTDKKILYRVINCAAHKKRLSTFRNKAEIADIPHVTRTSCINGRKFTDKKFCSMIRKGILDYKANLTPTEVAICMSHAKCWKQLINSKSNYMVVFEDDCRPYKSFMKKFDAVMDADLNFDILWLYNGNWMRTKNAQKKVTIVDNISIYRETTDYNASGSCYVITKKWAKILYDKMFPILEPVDNFMGSVRIKGGKHYTVQNKKRKDASFDCFTISPFMYVPCPGESSSTQTYQSTEVADTLHETPLRSRMNAPLRLPASCPIKVLYWLPSLKKPAESPRNRLKLSIPEKFKFPAMVTSALKLRKLLSNSPYIRAQELSS